MTNEQLQRRWIAGESLDTIADDDGRSTRGSIASRIRRLRAKEGVERWPHREYPIHPRAADAPPDPPKVPRFRSGGSTLPPLPSLAGHGPTPRR